MAHLDYGLVSNGLVAALVGPQSEIDWLCMPKLDSPSVLTRLLDREKGGEYAVEVDDPNAHWSQHYEDGTNVLVTRCELVGGAFEVIDAAVLAEGQPVPELVRLVRPVAGAPKIRLVFDPRLDYARAAPTIAISPGIIRAGELSLTFDAAAEQLMVGRSIGLEKPLAMVLAWGKPSTQPTVEAVEAAIEASCAADRTFVTELEHRDDQRVIRSALVLRAHTAPSGAIAAATTTSVPEAIGTPRTWDYRYAWVRDGCLAAHALLSLGDRGTADRLLDFFEAACPDGKPQPLYGLDGRSKLTESELPHLAGFADTKPVRIGNAAAEQSQHDSTGQLIWLAAALHPDSHGCSEARLAWIGRLADEASRCALTADAGIWEFRDRPGLYTFSQLWIWVALDRAAAMMSPHDETRADELAKKATEVRERILAAGERAGFFAQTLDGDDVDASSLLLAPLGLVEASHPLFLATIDRIESELRVGDLLARYAIEDDFGDTTSAFSLCQLWHIAALKAAGRADRAAELLDAFMALANPVGLYSEDIEPTSGRPLGNFPQVYTHTGIIEAIRGVE